MARRRPLRALLTLSAVAILTALIVANVGRGSAAPKVDALTSGAISVSNSRDGRPIFAVSGLAPGESATGKTTVANDGTASGALQVSAANLIDVPGKKGGALSSRLRLRIDDVTSGSNLRLYEGGFDGPANLMLPVLVPGDERTYRFTATFPDGGIPLHKTSGDNAFQGSWTGVNYVWTLAAAHASACGNPFRGTGDGDRVVGTQSGDRLDGHAGPDSLIGGQGADCVLGGLGADTIGGNAGEDRLRGAGGSDRLRGGGGEDRVLGGYGSDHLNGGDGNDRLRGNGGDDRLSGGSGQDRLRGGLGNDVIFARDGTRDLIGCGPGRDRAIVDHLDRVRGCEVVERPTSGSS